MNVFLKTAFLAAAFGILSSGQALAQPLAHFSETGQLVQMDFDGQVLYHSQVTPTVETAQKAIAEQLKFFIGQFVHENAYAAYREDIKPIRYLFHKINDELFEIYYTVSIPAVIEKNLLKDFTFTLPRNLSTVFRLNQKKDRSGKMVNTCVDEKGRSVGSNFFWYHWNPYAEECDLIEDFDFLRIKPRLFPKAASKPQPIPFSRLAKANGVIEVFAFFGQADDEGAMSIFPSFFNATESSDFGALEYEKVRGWLMEKGFQQSHVWTNQDFKNYTGRNPGGSRHYVQTFTHSGGLFPIKIHMFYGITSHHLDSHAFHLLLQKAMGSASFIFYGGHSGLGENLNIPQLEKMTGLKFEFAQDQYQWLYLDSCVSYHYYVDMFHGLKPKDLVIWSNINESNFGLAGIDFLKTFKVIWNYNQSTLGPLNMEFDVKNGIVKHPDGSQKRAVPVINLSPEDQ